jgi:hypothetical protein
VRVFEVFDADAAAGALRRRLLRASQQAGRRVQDSFVEQSVSPGTKPAVVTVLNFTKPVPGQKCLLPSTTSPGSSTSSRATHVRERATPRFERAGDFVEFLPDQRALGVEPAVFAN